MIFSINLPYPNCSILFYLFYLSWQISFFSRDITVNIYWEYLKNQYRLYHPILTLVSSVLPLVLSHIIYIIYLIAWNKFCSLMLSIRKFFNMLFKAFFYRFASLRIKLLFQLWRSTKNKSSLLIEVIFASRLIADRGIWTECACFVLEG